MHDHHRMQRLATCGSGCGLRGRRACERQAVRQVTNEHCFCSGFWLVEGNALDFVWRARLAPIGLGLGLGRPWSNCLKLKGHVSPTALGDFIAAQIPDA